MVQERDNDTKNFAIGCIIVFIIEILLVVCLTYKYFDAYENIYCTFESGKYNLKYPINDTTKYIISFNTSIMQSNYVWYINTNGKNSCPDCQYFRNDPYKIDNLTDKDYYNIGYDRGHLVPNADYGYDTYIITNAVPLMPKFNRKIWYESEKYLRDKFHNKLVIKGCDYDYNNFIINSLNHKLYIPSGCYYLVLDSNVLPNYASDINYKLLDHGYLINQDVSEVQHEYPFWANCK